MFWIEINAVNPSIYVLKMHFNKIEYTNSAPAKNQFKLHKFIYNIYLNILLPGTYLAENEILHLMCI